jgi:PIN domain-containing protein
MLVDTCVWLDLARDPSTLPLIGALEELVGGEDVILVVTRSILDEFAQNKVRLVEDSRRSVSSTRMRAKGTAEKLRKAREKGTLIKGLPRIDHRLVNLRDQAVEIVERIEALLAASELHVTTDAIKVRASDRGIEKRAPFHRQRNGMNDAILVETYADMVGDKEGAQRFAFVTHNVKDFSDPTGNLGLPHPDLAHLFTSTRSRYFTTLGEALRSIRPEQYVDLDIEQERPDRSRRRIAEIVAAEHHLFEKAWYSQHLRFREMVESGRIKIVEEEAFPFKDRRGAIQRHIWEAVLRAGKRLEERHGLENLGPWSDFEWGMINGKLSALRWVLGDEWDMLT